MSVTEKCIADNNSPDPWCTGEAVLFVVGVVVSRDQTRDRDFVKLGLWIYLVLEQSQTALERNTFSTKLNSQIER